MPDAKQHTRLWPQIRTKSQTRAGILFKKRGAQGSHACPPFARPFFLAPNYFQAPATPDSTSPPTSTPGSATDIISIQPCFQIVSVRLWLVTRCLRADKRIWAVNDLQLSFSFVEQINAGNKIPQLLLFITNRFSPV